MSSQAIAPAAARSTGSAREQSAGPESSERLLSLDALRGFDMFWIIGAEAIVEGLNRATKNPVFDFAGRQLSHAEWAGFRFYDLIFPLFVFIVGVSIVFSLERALARQGKAAACIRIARRSAMLILLGIFYNGGISHGIDHVRLLGVLQRIGLCYLFAATMFCTFSVRGLVAAFVGLLVGYWALMTFVPVPGIGAGKFDPGANLSNYIDSRWLPLARYDGKWDPEGLLSTIPAIGTCLLGVFAGLFLKHGKARPLHKAALLFGAGIVLAAAGWLWGMQFPVIKKIWTSSYVLVAGGYSCMLLGLFYLVVDVWRLRAWALPFVWIGVNPITLYLLQSVMDVRRVVERIVGGPVKAACGSYGLLMVAVAAMGLNLLIAWYLYRRRIFLRV